MSEVTFRAEINGVPYMTSIHINSLAKNYSEFTNEILSELVEELTRYGLYELFEAHRAAHDFPSEVEDLRKENARLREQLHYARKPV